MTAPIWHSHEVRFTVQLGWQRGWLAIPTNMCEEDIPPEVIDQYIRDKIKAMVSEQLTITYEVLK